jgi:hypothetical protein
MLIKNRNIKQSNQEDEKIDEEVEILEKDEEDDNNSKLSNL